MSLSGFELSWVDSGCQPQVWLIFPTSVRVAGSHLTIVTFPLEEFLLGSRSNRPLVIRNVQKLPDCDRHSLVGVFHLSEGRANYY